MSDHRSEVRNSTIVALDEKVSKGNYHKYLKRVILKKVRGFVDREITFDFPVTALVGPNGGGKTCSALPRLSTRTSNRSASSPRAASTTAV
ncbi:AAA family ATPase [Kitasatospora sp. NPDC006697]|uniref:AAA family ATPase n=1 Tax=Kitasatospora sp. NPDC006697 TaxID=3364020 RepID=UPI0036BBB7CF